MVSLTPAEGVPRDDHRRQARARGPSRLRPQRRPQRRGARGGDPDDAPARRPRPQQDHRPGRGQLGGAGRELRRRGALPGRARDHLQAHPAAPRPHLRDPGEELLQVPDGRRGPRRDHPRRQGRGARHAQRVPPPRRAHLRRGPRLGPGPDLPLPRVVVRHGRRAQGPLRGVDLRRVRQVHPRPRPAAVRRGRRTDLRVPDPRTRDRHRLLARRIQAGSRGAQARRRSTTSPPG